MRRGPGPIALVCIAACADPLAPEVGRAAAELPAARAVTRFGGLGPDSVRAIALSGNDDALVTGSYSGDVELGSTLRSAGSTDLYVARIDPAGRPIWARSWGGAGPDIGRAIGVDRAGDIFVAGSLDGAAALIKLDPTGNNRWSRSYPAGSRAIALAIDPTSGDVFVAGLFSQATIDLGLGAIINAGPPGTADVFLMRVNGADGSTRWATALGGTQDDGLYFGADSALRTAIPGPGSNRLAVRGGVLALVADFQSVAVYDRVGLLAHHSGVVGEPCSFLVRTPIAAPVFQALPIASSVVPGSKPNVATSVLLSASGEAIVGGWFSGTLRFSAGAPTVSALGTRDAFVVSYGTGVALWGRVFGAPLAETAINALAPDPAGNLILAGTYAGNVSIAGVPLATSGGARDAFLAKLVTGSGADLWARQLGVPGVEEAGIAVATSTRGALALAVSYDGPTDLGEGPLRTEGASDVAILRSTNLPEPIAQDSGADSLVVLEAEESVRVSPASGHTWLPEYNAAASGNMVLRARPSTGLVLDSTNYLLSPRLDFVVSFVRTGHYYVLVRGLGAPGDNSCHVGIDGAPSPAADRISPPGDVALPTPTWISTTLDGPGASLDVTTTGTHTISVWMMEDGFGFDRLILTTNPSFSPVGAGPAPSQRVHCGNGIVDGSEDCDGGACCAYDCTLLGPDATCRASAGPCDLAEQCSGDRATCPPDSLAPTSLECRASTGPCDSAERCDGLAPECPPDEGTAACGTPLSDCGNGVLDPSESCDDANVVAGDGCDLSCAREASDFEIEPNDLPSQAPISALVGIGRVTRRGHLGAEDTDLDLYRFQVPSGPALYVTAHTYGSAGDFHSCPGRTIVALLDAQGFRLGWDNTQQHSDDRDRRLGDCSIVADYGPLPPGTYYLSVAPFADYLKPVENSPIDYYVDLSMAAERACANGVLDLGEVCDDGNASPGDGCDACVLSTGAACGNGYYNLGEECDDSDSVGERRFPPTSGDGCSLDCRLECGNRALDLGEECDDGNTVAGDGCSSRCRTEGCGNGRLDPGEACDHGARNGRGGEGCALDCQLEPGILAEIEPNQTFATATFTGLADVGETNIGGTLPVNYAYSYELDVFRFAVPAGPSLSFEARTQARRGSPGSCNGADRLELFNSQGERLTESAPTVLLCAELAGIVLSPGHYFLRLRAAPGAADHAYVLSLALRSPSSCGDGTVSAGETCDDGNTASGDGCSSDCQLESRLFEAEPNDDEANAIGLVLAEGTLQLISGTIAPGGDRDVFRIAYAGPAAVLGVSSAEAAGVVFEAVTGEGATQRFLGFMELRPYGHTSISLPGPGEYYLRVLATTTSTSSRPYRIGLRLSTQPTCGNALVETGERCDGRTNASTPDGFEYWTRGCDPWCSIQQGCGNHLVERVEARVTSANIGDWPLVEECDGTFGCTTTCRLVGPGGCGNGLIELAEQCDDGSDADGDGCDHNCLRETFFCGDGTLDVGELCDDGNSVPGDGCDELCLPESIAQEAEPNDEFYLATATGLSGEGSVLFAGSLSLGARDRDYYAFSAPPEFTARVLVTGLLPGVPCTSLQLQFYSYDLGVPQALGPPQDACQSRAVGPLVGGDYLVVLSAPQILAGWLSYRLELLLDPPGACGNGVRTGVEECDDGNQAVGDGCNLSCRIERCGNGDLDPGEACDSGPSCDASCAQVGRLSESEPNDDLDGANPLQVSPFGVPLEVAGELRDFDGDYYRLEVPPGMRLAISAQLGGPGGDPQDCQPGMVLFLFDPDRQNVETQFGFSATCPVIDSGTNYPAGTYYVVVGGEGGPYTLTLRLSGCGNSVVEGTEGCDDGGIVPGDGCNEWCIVEGCGNYYVEAGETCDDGNTVPGDGCGSTCLRECGNAVLDPGELCDDGNTVSGDGCSSGCVAEVCGNGVVTVPERCDDGNTNDDDGCDARCQVECGNTVINGLEQCDDGNRFDGDGCAANCQLEGPCGDQVLNAYEECDDGNVEDGDGCAAGCRSECGNGALDGAEECDDFARAAGDFCGPGCTFECGNGVLDPGEECDDGNRVEGDDCDAHCTPSGALWALRLGVPQDVDAPPSLARDEHGNMVVAGELRAAVDLGTGLLEPAPPLVELVDVGQGLVPVNRQGLDFFLAKLSPSGAVAWSRRYGGTATERVTQIGLDSRGDVFVLGDAEGLSSAQQTTMNVGGSDSGLYSFSGRAPFLAKYSGSDGRHLWSRSLPSGGRSLSIDGQGDAQVALPGGSSPGSNPILLTVRGTDGADLRTISARVASRFGSIAPSAGAADPSGGLALYGVYYEDVDVGGVLLHGPFLYESPGYFVARYNSSTGALRWAVDLPRGQRIFSLATGPTGDVYVAGDAGSDVILYRLNAADGGILWSERYPRGLFSQSRVLGMAVTRTGRLSLVLRVDGTIEVGGRLLRGVPGTWDNFVVELAASDGAYRWSKRFGSSPGVQGAGPIALGEAGAVVVTGVVNFSGVIAPGLALRGLAEGPNPDYVARSFVLAFKAPGSLTGNAVLDPGEACDSGSCCSAYGELLSRGLICRSVASPWDSPESCDGLTAECPADRGAAEGALCDDGNPRTHSDTLSDLGVCRGTLKVCPSDLPCVRYLMVEDGTPFCAAQYALEGTPCSDGHSCASAPKHCDGRGACIY